MRGWIVIGSVAAAACRSAPAPSAPVAATVAPTGHDATAEGPLGIDWSTARWSTDEEALALWERLDLTWATWQERLAQLPDRPGLREALARALLRAGDFACRSVEVPVSCGVTERRFVEPRPDAGLDEPCVRRQLAMWALDQLEREEIAELLPVISRLASLPPPETELNRAVIEAAVDEASRVPMIGAAHRAGTHVGEDLLRGMSTEALEDALTRYHVDAALDLLLVEQGAHVGIGSAIFVDELQPATRARAVRELARISEQRARDDPRLGGATAAERRRFHGTTLRDLASRSDRCEVVAEGWIAYRTLAGGPVRVAAPTDAESVAFAACVALLAAPTDADAWRDLVATGGLVVATHHDDGDEFRTIPLDDRFAAPFEDELRLALPDCRDLECEVPNTGVWFKLVVTPERRGQLQLREIHRYEGPPPC